MARYTVSIVGATLSTTNDTKTIVTTATGAGSVVRVLEYQLSGEATASAANRTCVNRPGSVGVTGSGAQTPEKLNVASGAASFTIFTGWSTQPTLSTNHVLVPTINAFGGSFRWVAPPDCEIVVGGAGAVANLSFRSLSGTSVVSGHILIEEL
jgi:hypothetical protein